MANADQDKAGHVDEVINDVQAGRLHFKQLKDLEKALDAQLGGGKQFERAEQNYHTRTTRIVDAMLRLGRGLLASLFVLVGFIGSAVLSSIWEGTDVSKAYFVLLLVGAVCVTLLLYSTIQVLGRLIDRH